MPGEANADSRPIPSDEDLANAWQAQEIAGSDGDSPDAAPEPAAESASPPEGNVLDPVVADLQRQVAYLTGLAHTAPKPKAQPADEDDDPEPPAVYDVPTAVAAMEWNERKKQKEAQQKEVAYQAAYARALVGIFNARKMSQEDRDEMLHAMFEGPDLNAAHYDASPAAGAKINFLLAREYLRERKAVGTAPNLRQENGKGAAVAASSHGTSGKPTAPVLDEEARAFLKEMDANGLGMSDDEVAAALGRPLRRR